MIWIQDPKTRVFFVVLALIFLSIVAYFLARKLKGTMRIRLPKKLFGLGEQIVGEILLTTRKEIPCERWYVALIGTETTRGGQQSSTIEWFRQEFDLANQKVIPGDSQLKQAFSITLPKEIPEKPALNISTGNQLIDNLANTVLVLNRVRGRLCWRLECHLQCPGVDLFDQTNIHVNL